MLAEKSQNRDFRLTRIKTFFISFILTVSIASNTQGFSSRPPSTESVEFVNLQSELKEPNTITTQRSDIIISACKLIYEGKFDKAGALIKESSYDDNPYNQKLLQIAREYQNISQRRQNELAESYKKELAELDKLRVAADANNSSDTNNIDANDANDVNEITKNLSVIARAVEFANEEQKKELFANPLVQSTFQRAKDKASEYESEGKWLDAYLICYSWLSAINKDNKEYTDYAEELIEKANIVASFQDSPCETSNERYKGVTKDAFKNSMNILKYNYVKEIIDYKQMISKAINRCKLLAEVLTLSYSEIAENNAYKDIEGTSGNSFTPPDRKKLEVWKRELDKIRKEAVEGSLSPDENKIIEVLEQILELNKKTAELPQTILVTHYAEAALSALDPYTVIVWPQQTKDFEKIMTNEFTGIGVEISKPKGLLTVGSLLPDTPAYNSGLDAGDIIEAVDGIPTKDMSLNCAVKYITGPSGTDVKLKVRSPGEETTQDIIITRAKIIVRTIRGWQRTEDGGWLYTIDDKNKIGYIRITSFTDKTPSDLEKVLTKLEADGLKGLILDLRFNSGGLLSSATDVADKFISKGIIVSTRPRQGLGPYTFANKKGIHPNYPLVILINSGSASASEIVSGALNDKAHERAVLVGERTHGKGSVQTITSRPGGGAQLKYTMAYYYLPSNQRVESREEMKEQGRQDWGIGPDIEVKMGNGVLAISDELKKMLEIRRENDVLVKSDHKKDEQDKKHTVEETLESDPQLAVAVLVIKAKLIEQERLQLNPEILQTAAK